MKAYLFPQKIKNLFLGLVSSFMVLSCGSFQSASYFETDGIYVSKAQTSRETSQEINKNNYYSQYFKDVADGNVSVNSDETYFTDADGYTNSEQYQTSTIDNGYGYNQTPWGGETSQTEIIVVNNTPNYMWGLSGFSFGYSPFWNDYYGNHFRFGYGNFYNPYYGYYGGRYAGLWGGFNSFYSPFNYYGGFYNGYGNPWNPYNRWNRNRNGYANRFGNQFNNNNAYNSTLARVKSGRGEKKYTDSRRKSKEGNARQSKTNNADVQRTIDRINVGRGVNSFGRNIVIGNTNNNRLGVKTSGNSITARPRSNSGTTAVSRSGNTNPTKSTQNITGRFKQSRYNSGARNIKRSTSPRSVRTSPKTPPQRTTRQYNNNNNSRYKNTNNNSFRNTNSSRSTPSAPSRSFSSGSRSSSSSSSAGRGSSSGRKN